MKKILQKLLAPNHLEYLTLNHELMIVSLSADVQRFADCPSEVRLGGDVRLGFPELIGTEDLLNAVLTGLQDSFELKGIGRFPTQQSPLYLDFYVNLYQDDDQGEKQLILFFEDVTDRMALEQRLVQSSNETHLLLNALSKSRNYIKQVINSMADALVVTKSSGIIKSLNPAAQQLFGYQEEQLEGQPISLLIADQNFLNLIFQEKILTNIELLKNLEVVCKNKDGKNIVVEFSCSNTEVDIAIKDEIDSEGSDLIFIGRNITERQRTQQRLTAQYSTARVLSEATNFEKAIPKILLGICESLKWTVAEFWMVEDSNESQHPNQNPPENSQFLKCIEIWSRPLTVDSEFMENAKKMQFPLGVGFPGLVWATHEALWVSDVWQDERFCRRELAQKTGLRAAFCVPILSDGEVLGVMMFFSREVQLLDEDLLQTMNAIGSQVGQFIKRKRAEKALSESEERYRDLFENATDLIQSVGETGQFIYVNRAWKETLGYSETELDTMTVFDVLHPDCIAHCLELFQSVMNGQHYGRVQAAFLSKDGRKISVEGSVNCKFVDGKPVATRAIFRDITERLQVEEALRHEREQTERLLLNILPEPIADRLRNTPATIAENFAAVTVLFADIVGFTEIASTLSPIALVNLLNQIFSDFDRLTEHYNLEKIKTIGDAYMVVGGLPKRRLNHADAIAEMALGMQDSLTAFNQKNHQNLQIRIGIHSGPVVAGVIGIKKFIYDLWGDTVNTASRMESHGLPGTIHVSHSTYKLLRNKYNFAKRGMIPVKGKGEMMTYFLLGKKEDNYCLTNEGNLGNQISITQATQKLIKLIQNKLKQTAN